MDLSPNTRVLVFGAVGWTCFFCLQGALNWTKQNRPQYLFLVRYGYPRPSRHPQEARIQQLRSSLDLAGLRRTLQCERPEAHSCLQDLDFTWVGRKRELKALVQLLKSCKVFAVDLEAHSVFAYQTMPCLLQLAVGSQCFAVDLLALHDCMSILKAPFEDANILKLFHSCVADLQWLQQLDIYPVNVLDTCALAEEAVRVNRVKKPGLGSLLAELCGVHSNKVLAAGDWRVRPLSEEMLFYSVSDVNYLQFIAMTLVDFSLEDVPAPAELVTEHSGGDRNKTEAVCSAFERNEEGDHSAAVVASPNGRKEGLGATENAAEGLQGSLATIDDHFQELSSQQAAANAVDLALDDGMPVCHMDRAPSLEVTTAPLDELQHPFSPPAVLNKRNLHRQNSRRSDQAADTADCSRNAAGDCVDSTASAACNTATDVAADLFDEHQTNFQQTGLKDHVLMAAPASTCNNSYVQEGLKEAANKPDGSNSPQQSTSTVPGAVQCANSVAVDAPAPGTISSTAAEDAPTAEFADPQSPAAAPLEERAGGVSGAPAGTSSADSSAPNQKRAGKKDKKQKRGNDKHADSDAGPVQPIDVSRVWCKSCDRTMVVHRQQLLCRNPRLRAASVVEVASAAMTRLVNREVEYRSKSANASKQAGVALVATEAAMLRIVAVVCYWRTAVAQLVDISPVMILPDALVKYLLKHRPRGTLSVVRCMLRWVSAHREKHAARFKLEAEARAEGPGVSTGACSSGSSNTKKRMTEKNPFAWYLDHWSPGCAIVLAAPWLAWLLWCAYTGRVSVLPVQVERMIAQLEVKHQVRKGAATSTNKTSQKKQAAPAKVADAGSTAKQRPAVDAAASGAAPQGPSEQKMTRERIISKFSKKKPAYSSCRMLSQEGGFLAACDLKKLVWYVKKGLGQWEPGLGPESAQPTIRLNFQHKTNDQQSGDDFYNEVKANECVGCGEAGHYLKYKIVPDCYRKHFPVNMKSHRSHDIVLLCIDCHERAHTAAEVLKRHLASANGIPLQPAAGPIRSDPFLPTPPPEECCSSREDDADASSVATTGGEEQRSEAAVATTPNEATDHSSSDSVADIPVDRASCSSGAHLMEYSQPPQAPAAAPDCSRVSGSGVECSGANVGESTSGAGLAGARVANSGDTSSSIGGAGDAAAAAIMERMPSPAHVRRVALTLDRQQNLPSERRRALEAVIARYVHGPAAVVDQGLGSGDIEAALLAGLAKAKRNQTIARLAQSGRPPPSGYTLSEQAGRVSVISAPHHQGGHMWHGRKTVEKITATYGIAGLHVRAASA